MRRHPPWTGAKRAFIGSHSPFVVQECIRYRGRNAILGENSQAQELTGLIHAF
jgi:hypothetical protein